MQYTTTLHPEQEPTITVTVGNMLRTPFMIDTGAIYSGIGKEGSQLPLSSKAIQQWTSQEKCRPYDLLSLKN